MTHPFSGWRGSSCDVCNDGLRYRLFNEFGRLLFRGPTNFTHEDDSMGLAVLLEQCESVDHVRAVVGIAADSDARRLYEASLAHRVDELVSERPTPGEHARVVISAAEDRVAARLGLAG